MESTLFGLAGTAIALLVVIALAYVTLRLLRNPLMARADRAGGDADALRFVRALPLGPKERVVLVDCRGERCMLGVTAGSIRLLKSWPLDGATAGVDAKPREPGSAP